MVRQLLNLIRGLAAREDPGGERRDTAGVPRPDPDTAGSVTPITRRRILGLYPGWGLLTRADADHMLRWRGTDSLTLDGSVRVAALISDAAASGGAGPRRVRIAPRRSGDEAHGFVEPKRRSEG